MRMADRYDSSCSSSRHPTSLSRIEMSSPRRLIQPRQIIRGDTVHPVDIHGTIVVRQDVPHADDQKPGDFRRSPACVVRDLPCCLTDDLDTANDSRLNKLVRTEVVQESGTEKPTDALGVDAHVLALGEVALAGR